MAMIATTQRLSSLIRRSTILGTTRTLILSPSSMIGTDKGTKTSWQAEDNEAIQRVTQKAIIHELTQSQTKTIESVVPWFLNNMPAAYFRQVPYEYRMDHIKAISAVKDANMDLYLNLKTPLPDGGLILTFIRPGTQKGRLLELVQELPRHDQAFGYLPLSRAQVFGSNDESVSLSIFITGEQQSQPVDVEKCGDHILQYAKNVQKGEVMDDENDLLPSPLFEEDKLLSYMQHCSETYLTRSMPRRFLHQRLLFEEVTGNEGIAVHIEECHMDNILGQYWVDVAVANILPQIALEHCTQMLYHRKLNVERSHIDVISDNDNGTVTMLRMLVSPVEHGTTNKENFDLLIREAKRLKWLDPFALDLYIHKFPELGIDRAEVITALCNLMHPIMAKKNAFIFSKGNILHAVTKTRYISVTSKIADLFLDRFNPENPLSVSDLFVREKAIRAEILNSVEDTNAEELLNKMIDIVEHTLKTNMYLPNRYALGLRLNPSIMVAAGEENRELPYGVFFVHGRRFNAFHVRFRDVARGGMRLVTPPSAEQYALESARQYEECYGLAYAQQLKNKDIPEGGSKAVNLIDTYGLTDGGKLFVMRKSVKAFADALLDLIVDTEETRSCIVDLIGKKELIYLGPDEQVIPQDINWIVKRAAERGYDTPAAFMSSKPRAGINHKEYGVTSEGVNVYLDVALREVLNIDPTKDSFTIKMTGGPDGDVAGNEIKILLREYGANAKIVGIADHTGCAEDPIGLDHEELLRLVTYNLPIGNFDKTKLSHEGNLYLATNEEGLQKRNSMHNRVRADAFIPAGGRPNTIDIHNYKNFLKADGTPSSRLIVEGANLFITDEARQALHEDADVVIVKDSSANKAGVLTSSYEICAAMMLDEEEFFDNKSAIVDEVLVKLRELARMEAVLLFREFKTHAGSLPHFSQVISKAINNVKDEIIAALESMTDDEIDELLPLFRAHLPKTLADLSFDRVHQRVPKQYIKNAIASSLASKMVYKEGFKFVEAQPKERLASIALDYIAKEKEVALLIEALNGSNTPEKEKKEILDLLDAGGARTALKVY